MKNKVSYNHDGIIKIIIEDHTGAKIDIFIANQKDKARLFEIGRALYEKYGIDLTYINNFLPKEEKDIFDF